MVRRSQAVPDRHRPAPYVDAGPLEHVEDPSGLHQVGARLIGGSHQSTDIEGPGHEEGEVEVDMGEHRRRFGDDRVDPSKQGLEIELTDRDPPRYLEFPIGARAQLTDMTDVRAPELHCRRSARVVPKCLRRLDREIEMP